MIADGDEDIEGLVNNETIHKKYNCRQLGVDPIVS